MEVEVEEDAGKDHDSNCEEENVELMLSSLLLQEYSICDNSM